MMTTDTVCTLACHNNTKLLSFVKFHSLVTSILSYGLFVNFKSRAINRGLLILYEHWHVITIQNC